MCFIARIPGTPIDIHLGYHINKEPDVYGKVFDACTAVAYLAVIPPLSTCGMIIGVARMIFGSMEYLLNINSFFDFYKRKAKACFFRGAWEACSFFSPIFTVALLAADIFVTMYLENPQ
ncbi:MAG: hypothetical protein WB791_06625 [Waddliaceae bacterium]